MAFNWARAIEKNREDLISVVTTLFVMAGIRTGKTVTVLPRFMHRRILGLLRPAEYAARRLILMAACKLAVIAAPPATASRGSRQAGSDAVGRETGGKPADPAQDDAIPAFSLFDPFKRPAYPWIEPEDLVTTAVDDAGDGLPPGEPVGAGCLCRRIRALEGALQDLEGAALRLARWRARRYRDPASSATMSRARPRRWSVLRPGRPPGWKRRPKTQVEAVLHECHSLAREAWNTS